MGASLRAAAAAVLVMLGLLHPSAMAPAAAAAGARAAADEVSCPATLDGVPLDLDEEFAGTPRALANDEGILVRFTLLCPYHRGNGTSVADITLAWSKYAADDLRCATVELTSEPAGDGRVRGLVDHPSLRAQVTYDALSEEVLPAVDEVATELLADVPRDAAPCAGGGGANVDAHVTVPATEASSDLPLALAVAVLAASAVVVLVVVMLVRRGARRRKASTPAGDPEVGALAAAIRARRLEAGAAEAAGATPGRGTNGTAAPPAAGAPVEDAHDLVGERQNAMEVRRGATAAMATIEQVLERARADLGRNRAHARAVRTLAASLRDSDGPEFLWSYAGVMAFAVAATNLAATTARGAALLLPPAPGERGDVTGPAARLEGLHRQVLIAAESGLDDTRYWLWQERRMAVVDALAALQQAAPELIAAQERLAARVADLAREHAVSREEAEWAQSVIDEADHRLVDGGDGPSATPFESAGV